MMLFSPSLPLSLLLTNCPSLTLPYMSESSLASLIPTFNVFPCSTQMDKGGRW